MAETASPGQDRRQHARKVLRGSGQMIVQDRQVTIRMQHLSSAGLGIIVASNLPAKTPCTVRFVIPGKTGVGESFDVNVHVIHSVYGSAEGGFKVGVQFDTISPALAAAVAQYLTI